MSRVSKFFVGSIGHVMTGGRRTWASTDVVESELGDAGVELEEERERLSNATGGTEDGDLRELFELC